MNSVITKSTRASLLGIILLSDSCTCTKSSVITIDKEVSDHCVILACIKKPNFNIVESELKTSVQYSPKQYLPIMTPSSMNITKLSIFRFVFLFIPATRGLPYHSG